MPICAMLFFATLLTAAESLGSTHRYNICNGLSNQLLYHAGSIAKAVAEKKDVEIPDYFIVNGVQFSGADVLPSKVNSIPFGDAFDKSYFRAQVEKFGINARFVAFDFSATQLPCAGLESLETSDSEVALTILNAFRPSSRMSRIVDLVTKGFGDRSIDQGICLHHRDGQDWYEHCGRWESINDGIYRGNCRGVPGMPFIESLQYRGLTTSRWLYYCGDHNIPKDLSESEYDVMSRDHLLSSEEQKSVESIKIGQPIRDLWALVDFFVCGMFRSFIGNSVSTFSAVQIAMRGGYNSFWYNSQSIPLADYLRAYKVPIVYTYTELSSPSGRHLLEASIASIKRHMPINPIHVLYHGNQDTEFRSRLRQLDVVVHDHDPVWRDQIEEMRKHGDPKASHLFLHSGNYFGTWQRIDIPLMIDNEYCLLLDADTIIVRPFTMADFGLDLTHGIAMSSELHMDMKAPSNAGVTLMNIPYLRHTYNDFLRFVLKHVDSAKFDHPSPSDQGAYLDFYRSVATFLSQRFNFKPYWKPNGKTLEKPFIVHFHGAKPHDYIKYVLGEDCDEAIQFLCEQVGSLPFFCPALQSFALASKSVDPFAYCEASFPMKAESAYCNNVLDALVAKDHVCLDFEPVALAELARSPDRFKLPRHVLEKRMRNGAKRRRFRTLVLVAVAGWLTLSVLMVKWRRKLHYVALSALIWAGILLGLSHFEVARVPL